MSTSCLEKVLFDICVHFRAGGPGPLRAQLPPRQMCWFSACEGGYSSQDSSAHCNSEFSPAACLCLLPSSAACYLHLLPANQRLASACHACYAQHWLFFVIESSKGLCDQPWMWHLRLLTLALTPLRADSQRRCTCICTTQHLGSVAMHCRPVHESIRRQTSLQ